MSSSNNRDQSSNFHHRSLNDIRFLESSSSTDATWNGHSSNGYQSAVQAVQLANRLQQLQVNSDIDIASTQAINMDISTQLTCRHNESLAEEELIERLKELINEFMTRPGRRYSYNTTIRWTVDHGNEINYSVVILINQPSYLI